MLSNSSKSSEAVQGIVSSDKSSRTFNFPPNNKARADDHPFLGTKSDRKFEYLDCDKSIPKKNVLVLAGF